MAPGRWPGAAAAWLILAVLGIACGSTEAVAPPGAPTGPAPDEADSPDAVAYAPTPAALARYFDRVREQSPWSAGRLDLFSLSPTTREGVLDGVELRPEKRLPFGVRLERADVSAHRAAVTAVSPDGFTIRLDEQPGHAVFVVLRVEGLTPPSEASALRFEVALPAGVPRPARARLFWLTEAAHAEGHGFDVSAHRSVEIDTPRRGFATVDVDVTAFAGEPLHALRIDLPDVPGETRVRGLGWIANGGAAERSLVRPDREIVGHRVGAVSRPARVVLGESRIAYALPEGARRHTRLDLALAALPRSGPPFEARVEIDGEIVWRRTLTGDAPSPAWLEVSLLLDPPPRTIALSTHGGGGGAALLWGAPRVVERIDDAPAVVLVTLDTVRRDRASGFGGVNPTFAAIQSRAHDGRSYLFHAHRSQSTVTTPSHASLLTGQTPPGLGVRANADWTGGSSVLRDDFVTLAEIHRAAGFETGAFVSAAPVAAIEGLAQGFDVYDGGEQTSRRAEETVLPAVDWLRGRRGRPVFLWLHLYDPHGPYDDAPAHHRDRFLAALDASAAADPRSRVLASYDGEIAYADASTGLVLSELALHWPDAKTTFAVTADHGESFGEHEVFGDHFGLFDVNLRVPFVLRGPAATDARGGPHEIDVPTSNLDLAPTLLALAHLPVPPWMQGLPLFDAKGRLRLPPSDRPQAAWWQASSSVVAGGLRLVRRPEAIRKDFDASGGRPPVELPAGVELYDLKSDPFELRNLAAVGDPRIARLEALLAAAERPPPETRPLEDPGPAIPEAQRRRLEALGYSVDPDE